MLEFCGDCQVYNASLSAGGIFIGVSFKRALYMKILSCSLKLYIWHRYTNSNCDTRYILDANNVSNLKKIISLLETPLVLAHDISTDNNSEH